MPAAPSWATGPTGAVVSQSEVRCITPDGKYAGGVFFETNANFGGNQMHGFVYNIRSNLILRPVSGSYAMTITGAGYRTNEVGAEETIFDGFGAGWKLQFKLGNAFGTNFTGKVRQYGIDTSVPPDGQIDPVPDFTSGGGPHFAYANTLGTTTNSDVWYSLIQGFAYWEDGLKHAWTYRGSNSFGTANFTGMDFGTYSYLAANNNWVKTYGIAATGRTVGKYQDYDGDNGYGYGGPTNATINFVIEWPPRELPGLGWPPSDVNEWTFNGLDGSPRGAAYAVTPDGNLIFGHSPLVTAGWWYGYKAFAGPGLNGVTNIAMLPVPGNAVAKPTGVSWVATPFGCSADGRYAVGCINFTAPVGEKAFLWDTADPEPLNWTCTDLTALAGTQGILESPGLTNLVRAYSVGVNADGKPVVAGYGQDSNGKNKGFVMIVEATNIVPAPQITGITGAGTSSITVNYNNTVPGQNYQLQYKTDLNAAGWGLAGEKVATGTNDSQTETGVSSAQRFYRIVAP